MAETTTYVDIKLASDINGVYDISFDESGDFELDNSYETAIRMSLFLDARADESEVAQPELRRGWHGNYELYNVDHESGSKLWLLEQKRNTVKVRNDASGYIQQCLQWFINDNHAKTIEVDAEIDRYDLSLTTTITYSPDIIKSYRFGLWSNTAEL